MATAAEKKDEKVEKRRALGRGLESLLPGPRSVPSSEARVASGEQQPPQGLKPEPSLASISTLRQGSGQASEAVPFPGSAAGSDVSGPVRGGAGEQQIPFDSPSPIGSGSLRAGSHFVRNDKSDVRNDKSEVGNDKSTGEMDETPEVISIQAVAMPGNLVVNLDVALIEKNPYQTRYVFDEDKLEELRDSIKEHGVMQPVVVRPGEQEGSYILVLGERRLRAAKMAGKDTVPALVRRLSPQQAAEMTVLENVAREDLNPLEQAEAFRVLSKEFHLTQAQIAERLGVSRETVSNYMRLLRLPEQVMNYLLEERLTFSDARLILALENPEHIEAVAEEVVTKHLKWDEIEDRVMRINGSLPLRPGETVPGAQVKKTRGARWVDPNVRAAQMEMERTLGMRVRIRDRNGKGRIVIEYASVDDYERVVGLLKKK